MAILRGYGASDDPNNYSSVYQQLTGVASSEAQTPSTYVPKDQSDYEAVTNIGASKDDSPVPLTEVPTSSLDASRPRTVAAGYLEYSGSGQRGQAVLGKMTVMFRDGTLYNYYDVTPGEWASFRSSISKGAPWLNKGFPNGKQQVDGVFIGKPRGPANLTNVDAGTLESIYRVARVAQVRFSNKRSTTVKLSNGLTAKAPQKVRVNAKQKVKAAAKAANPHRNNGKNPYQK